MASVSDSWHNRLERRPDGRVMECFLPDGGHTNGDPLVRVGVSVPKFRGSVPLGYVARVLRKDQKTVRRMVANGKIPGWFKTQGGHYRIRHCREFWNWLSQQWQARESHETCQQFAACLELQESIMLLLALKEMRTKCGRVPSKQFTSEDFEDAYNQAFYESEKRYGVRLERIPPDVAAQVRQYPRWEWEIAYKVLEWQMTDTLPDTGVEAGRRVWGDDSWESYQVSRRREFVAIFQRWKKRLKKQDVGWLPDKQEVENKYGVTISPKAWLGERLDGEDDDKAE